MSSFFALISLIPLLLQTPVQRNSDIENIGHRDINSGCLSISRDREIELGRQIRIDLERNVKLYQQPEVTAYVNSIVQLLAANSDTTTPIASGIIDSDEIDTIALPGGTVYVTTGLIRTADNEAELAAALAHAIAHVAARHAAEMAMKMELINQASVPLLRGTPNTQFNQFARKNVTEADFLGLQYLYKAGWDPEAAIAFLVRCKHVPQLQVIHRPRFQKKRFKDDILGISNRRSRRDSTHTRRFRCASTIFDTSAIRYLCAQTID